MSLKNLVLEGGGIRGLAHIGALEYLEKMDYLKEIDNFAGSSAGSIIASLYTIGYSVNELKILFLSEDLSKLVSQDSTFKRLYRLFTKYGMDHAKEFYSWFGDLIEHKTGNRNFTFKELYDRFNKTLVITGVSLNKKEVHYYHHVTNPNMPIRKAVRISIAIPLYFTPVYWGGDILVDGGVLENYPIDVFDAEYLPNTKNKSVPAMTFNEQTLGLKLMTCTEMNTVNTHDVDQSDTKIDSLLDFIKSLLSSFMAQIDHLQINEYYWKRTIPINTFEFTSTNWNLNKSEIERLIDSGNLAAEEYFNKKSIKLPINFTISESSENFENEPGNELESNSGSETGNELESNSGSETGSEPGSETDNLIKHSLN